jgi:hypothetical protein
MVLVLMVALAVGFVASLLPFLLPDAVISLLGVQLNGAAAPLVADLPWIGPRLVSGAGPARTLTLEGVLVTYVPALLVLLWIQRSR